MPAGMKYSREREWIRFRDTGTGSGETDIEVIDEYVASRSMNYGDRTWKIDDIELYYILKKMIV